MSDQLNLFDQRSAAERERAPEPSAAKGEPETIEQRWDAFATRNPHVLTAALEIARAWLERGDKYISAKAIMENLRVRNIKGGEVRGDGGYKLNNDFTAPLGRWLVQHEPKLDGVIRFRERKAR